MANLREFAGNVALAVRERALQVREFTTALAFDLKVDAQDALRTGLGVPRLVTKVASFACFAVAAGGTFSMSKELVGKVYGPKDCSGCNGWEGVVCTACAGTGRVQFLLRSQAAMPRGRAVAEAIVGGRADVVQLPRLLNTGAPLPTMRCQTCDGSGVMACGVCGGDARKHRFSFDRLFDAPWKAWDAYRLSTRVEPTPKAMSDPDVARYWLLDEPELVHGAEIPADLKEIVWKRYKGSQAYERHRSVVARRAPGWEEAQQEMEATDPSRALGDPVIVRDLGAARARQQLEAQVAGLKPPPRPQGWAPFPMLLKQPDWSRLADASERAELQKVMLHEEQATNRALDSAWAQQWRSSQVEEVVQAEVDKYLDARGQDEEVVLQQAERPRVPRSRDRPKKDASGSSRPRRAPAPEPAPDTQDADGGRSKALQRESKIEKLKKAAADRQADLARQRESRSGR